MAIDWIPIKSFRRLVEADKKGSTLKAMYGGSSAGKTVSILPYLYQKAVDNPGEIVSIFSDTLANLKTGAMRDFQQILESTGVWDPQCWLKSESVYHLHNGSKIEFIGADNESKVRGPRRDRCYINEANRVKYEVYQQLESRTRKEMILDWNPSGSFWYNEHILGVIDHDEIVVNFKDNEALDDKMLEKFARWEAQSTRSEYAMNYWKVFGLGEWGVAPGTCITDYKTIDRIPDGYKLFGLGLDFGNNDPNAAVALYENDEGKFIFDEVLYKNKLNMLEISKVLKEYDAWIYADYAWPQSIIELRIYGHNIIDCKKGPDSIKHGIDLINQHDISITSRSKNILNEVGLYRYKTDGDGNPIDGKYEGPDHLIDAMRYVLREAADVDELIFRF